MYIHINVTGNDQVGEIVVVTNTPPKVAEVSREEQEAREREYHYAEPQLQIVEG